MTAFEYTCKYNNSNISLLGQAAGSSLCNDDKNSNIHITTNNNNINKPVVHFTEPVIIFFEALLSERQEAPAHRL